MQIPWNETSPRPARFRAQKPRSSYVTMPDGVRIAVDVTLPHGVSEPLPTIFRQTRYHRRMHLRPPFHRMPLRSVVDQHHASRLYFVTRGYAWVDVCVRGSGASDGRRPMPWSDDERADGARLLSWIAEQPWSNGRVGARGISYDGTCAEFLLASNHPALAAVAPRFSLYDVFTDVALPGGIHLAGFTQRWRAFNDALDRNQFDEVLRLVLETSVHARRQLASSPYATAADRIAARAMAAHAIVPPLISRFVRGVAPTDDDRSAELLAAVLQSREPALDVHAAAGDITFRDDPIAAQHLTNGETIDKISPHAQMSPDSCDPDVPVYHYSGWFDGAYQLSAIKRFCAFDRPNHRLIIGPWEHGGRQDISPWHAQRSASFDHEAELMRFFDAHVLADPEALQAWRAEPRVRYYTLGAEQWRTSEDWPVSGRCERLHLAGESLRGVREPSTQSRELVVTNQHGTGPCARWSSLLPLVTLTHYTPRRGEVLGFTSQPLTDDWEVTGHPRVHVEMRSSNEDSRLFAYIEDVAPNGDAHYVTEGQLRALHRRRKQRTSLAGTIVRSFERRDRRSAAAGELVRMDIDLLPTSYTFKRGHRLRLVLAGSDRDHFEPSPPGTYSIVTSASWIDLPVVTSAKRR